MTAKGTGDSAGREQGKQTAGLSDSVARSRELKWPGRAEDEVNLKKPSPPSFYKLLGSRTVILHISL